MPVKKIREAIELTKKQTGLNDELIEDLSYFYFYVLRNKLSNMEHHNFQVQGLGSFKIGELKLKKFMQQQSIQAQRIKDEKARDEILKKLEDEKVVYEKIKAIRIKRYEFYDIKRKIKADYTKSQQSN